MQHTTTLTCPHCRGTDLVKNDHSRNGTQRWRCNKCEKSFQMEFRYNAHKAGIKQKILEYTLNSSGVRDISRIVQINKNTVIAVLKKTPKTNPYLQHMMEKEQLTNLEVVIGYTAAMDEFWSFVQTKTNQRWTWYAMDKRSGIILAWHNGKRTDEDLQILLKQIEDIPISKYYTDDWGAYSRLLPTQQHVIQKDNTWKIERKNLNFRTHIKRLNRRTICYSKNEQVHDNVIGMYIERYCYKTATYSNNDFNAFNP